MASVILIIIGVFKFNIGIILKMPGLRHIPRNDRYRPYRTQRDADSDVRVDPVRRFDDSIEPWQGRTPFDPGPVPLPFELGTDGLPLMGSRLRRPSLLPESESDDDLDDEGEEHFVSIPRIPNKDTPQSRRSSVSSHELSGSRRSSLASSALSQLSQPSTTVSDVGSYDQSNVLPDENADMRAQEERDRWSDMEDLVREGIVYAWRLCPHQHTYAVAVSPYAFGVIRFDQVDDEDENIDVPVTRMDMSEYGLYVDHVFTEDGRNTISNTLLCDDCPLEGQGISVEVSDEVLREIEYYKNNTHVETAWGEQL